MDLTTPHTIISLIAILTGLIVLIQLIAGKDIPGLTYTFLAAAAATSILGYFLPFGSMTPEKGVYIVAHVLLGFALGGYLGSRIAGWRIVYVITATIALYLDVFLFTAHASQTGLAFGAIQLPVLAILSFLGWRGVAGSRTAFDSSAKEKTAKWARPMSPHKAS